MNLHRSVVLFLSLLSGVPASAQELGLGLDVLWGNSGSGLSIAFGVPVAVRTPGAFAVYAAARPELSTGGGSESRYYLDDVGASGERCRDSETGQFVRSSLCTTVMFATDAEVGVRVGISKNHLLVGGGYRVGMGNGPYGSATFRFSSFPWYIRAEGGPEAFGVGVGIGNL